MMQPESVSPPPASLGGQSDLSRPPERFNAGQYLLECNSRRPDKIAFVDDLGSLSFAELGDRVRRLAEGMRALDLRREERILLLMHDGLDWPVSFLGTLYAGLVPVAVNTLLPADDYAYLLENSRAQAVLVSGALLPTLAGALGRASHEVQKIIVSRPVSNASGLEVIELETLIHGNPPAERPASTGADDPAFWLYSSGSTGRPKGTVHTHANLYWTAQLYGRNILQLTEQDVCFSAAKLFFAYGLGNALTFPLSLGATTILMGERPTPDAIFKRWRGEVGGFQPTVFFGAPTGFAAILASDQLPARDAIALRLVSSAGEALPAELGERFRRHFAIDIVDGIGSTEMLHIFLSNRPERVRYGTTGWPVPGYSVELRDEHGAPVPDGELGDLYIKGPSAALLYWGNREKTRETFQGAWTKSGDKYVRNEDGSYVYGGRSDDMIKVSGIYVSPFEVEATLAQHPGVLEAAVIGTEDAQGLIKSKAFVVLKPSARGDAGAGADMIVTEDELKAFVKERLAPHKYPRSVEFVGELPKTATGKIQRFRLRALERERRT
jgi:benzoate-CoA ligase